MATSGLAVGLYRTGFPEEGRRSFKEAVRLFKELGDLYNEARTWRNFGVSLRGSGQEREAEQAFQKALGSFAEFGDPCGEGDCWNGLCGILIERGDFNEALMAARRSVECHEGLDGSLVWSWMVVEAVDRRTPSCLFDVNLAISTKWYSIAQMLLVEDYGPRSLHRQH